jgi:hypothetical protein
MVAIILGAALLYLVGPLTGVAFPHDLFLRDGGTTISISGWTELIIFIIIIRALLGTEAAKKVLEDLF